MKKTPRKSKARTITYCFESYISCVIATLCGISLLLAFLIFLFPKHLQEYSSRHVSYPLKSTQMDNTIEYAWGDIKKEGSIRLAFAVSGISTHTSVQDLQKRIFVESSTQTKIPVQKDGNIIYVDSNIDEKFIRISVEKTNNPFDIEKQNFILRFMPEMSQIPSYLKTENTPKENILRLP